MCEWAPAVHVAAVVIVLIGAGGARSGSCYCANGRRRCTWRHAGAPQQQRVHVAGKRAEEFVQNLAAEKGVEGLQKWMDQQGLGASVMTAGEAMKKREAAAAAREKARSSFIRH